MGVRVRVRVPTGLHLCVFERDIVRIIRRVILLHRRLMSCLGLESRSAFSARGLVSRLFDSRSEMLCLCHEFKNRYSYEQYFSLSIPEIQPVSDVALRPKGTSDSAI